MKSRLVFCDIAKARPQGGELYAATPSFASLRTLLAVASARRNLARRQGGPPHGGIIGDVSQAFIHAKIDEPLLTRIPKSMEGLVITVDGCDLILHEGDLTWVLMALYGYRKAPRLWQDHFVDVAGHQDTRRCSADPAVFVHVACELVMIVHVDDPLILEEMVRGRNVFNGLKKELNLRQEGCLEHPGDSANFLG